MKLYQIIIAGFLTLALLVGVLTGITIVDVGNVGVVKVLGNYEKTALEPGLHLTIPYITDVVTIDTKIKSYPEVFSSYTGDGQKISVSGTVNYNNSADYAVQTASTIGTDNETITKVVLTPILLANVKDVIAKYTLEEIIAEQAAIGKEISDVIRESLKTQGSINLQGFEVTGFILDEDVQKSIEAKIISSQKQQQASIDLVTAQIVAQTNKALSDSLSPILVEQQRVEVLRQSVIKWDGHSSVFGLGQSETPIIVGK